MKRAMHALMVGIVLAACATSPSADIDFHYDTAADFTALKTFGWMAPTGNAVEQSSKPEYQQNRINAIVAEMPSLHPPQEIDG